MIWGSASEFFAMGGYGLYVWGSYGVIALCMLADAWIARQRHRAARAAGSGQSGENSGFN
ncbi:MAG TPA: heme exporter protein CcmD [Burkholderiaceae bacterium]|jgi:heme exporter protein D